MPELETGTAPAIDGAKPIEQEVATVKDVLHVLHCSDIHLDTPFVGMSAEKSEERRRELRASFLKLMQYIRDRGIDIVLISGDLFDTQYATNTTAEILIRELRNCSETVFIIAPGKSDYYENNPIYSSGRLPSNCYVFSQSALSRFDIDKYNVTVYGWAFCTPEYRNSPLLDKHVDDTSRINFVCGYADVDGEIDSASCPIPLSDIKKFGADYYAFGSRHEVKDASRLGDSMIAYSGSLECTGFDDPGLGGAQIITTHYNDGELSLEAKKLTFGRLRFRTEQIDITGLANTAEIIRKISTQIGSKNYGMETALRIELVGSVSPSFSVLKNFESDAFGLYYFDVVDKTLPLYGTEHFKRDMTTKGELFRTLLPMLEHESEEIRLIGAKAFRAGLAALEGREID